MPKAPEFRYIYSNGFGIRFGDNEVTVLFGIDESAQPNDGLIYEQVGVVMTHRTLKMLLSALGTTLESFERDFGEVKVPEGKLAKLEETIQATIRDAKNSQN